MLRSTLGVGVGLVRFFYSPNIWCYYPADVWHACAASGPHTAVLNPDPALSPPEDPSATLSLPPVLASMLSVKASVLTATIDTNIANLTATRAERQRKSFTIKIIYVSHINILEIKKQ